MNTAVLGWGWEVCISKKLPGNALVKALVVGLHLEWPDSKLNSSFTESKRKSLRSEKAFGESRNLSLLLVRGVVMAPHGATGRDGACLSREYLL